VLTGAGGHASKRYFGCAVRGVRSSYLCTPGMGVNLWGGSPLYVNSVNIVTVNISISRKQGRSREGPSEGSWSAKL